MTAKELKEMNKVDTGLDLEQPGHEPLLLGYFFDIESLQEFSEQLCREQREKCANKVAGIALSHPWFDLDAIINAPMPEL